MLEFVPTKKQIKLAKSLAFDLGRLKNSITKGSGNIAGFLGEIVCAEYFGAEIKDTYDYDLLKDELRIDVKTKRCNSEPKSNYFCSVADYNTKQDCHVYLFCRVLNDLSKVWILGWEYKDEFYRKATFSKKGLVDPSSPPNYIFRFRADCYNLEINYLQKPQELLCHT